MNTGDTLKIAVPGTTLDSHLWVVLSDPVANPEKIVLVNFTKHRDDKDQACVLEPGDHPYISVKTCVEYKRCKVVSSEEWEELVKNPNVALLSPVSVGVLQRILDGVANSRMNLEIAQFLEDQGMLEI